MHIYFIFKELCYSSYISQSAAIAFPNACWIKFVLSVILLAKNQYRRCVLTLSAAMSAILPKGQLIVNRIILGKIHIVAVRGLCARLMMSHVLLGLTILWPHEQRIQI